MLRFSWLFGFLMMAAFPVTAMAADDAKQAFQARTFRDGDKSLPYRVLFPENFDRGKKYPMVLFLHGAGERGTDNVVQLVHGMNDFAHPENRKKFPCFVIAPQCPEGKRWVEVDWSADSHKMPEKPSEPMDLVVKLLNSFESEFPVDKRREYVTGLSMGGYGTWDLIQRFPQRFAAAAPVCGGGDDSQAAKLVKLPLWVFHGAKDTVVKPLRSQRMIAEIEKAGGKPQYTEYPDVAHDSWGPAYRDPRLMEWMFNQRLME